MKSHEGGKNEQLRELALAERMGQSFFHQHFAHVSTFLRTTAGKRAFTSLPAHPTDKAVEHLLPTAQQPM